MNRVGEASVGIEEGVVGEDVWLRNFIEQLLGEGEGAALRVEEDEVVGDVS